MGLLSTLLFLSLTLVSGNLHSPREREAEKGATRTQDSRQHRSDHECEEGDQLCAPAMVKVIDLGADSDHESDSNGEYTSATLEAGKVPDSFTICAAFMTDAWTTIFTGGRIFMLLDVNGDGIWAAIKLNSAASYTQYTLYFGPVEVTSNASQIPVVLFPLQWTRVCLSLDSIARKVRLVVDGLLLVEEEYKREEDEYRPANLSLLSGYNPELYDENTGKLTNVNVFKSALSVERMKVMTMAGEEECGAPGDLVSWEEAEWTLHSQAKLIKVDKKWEGPCKKESKLHLFTADFESNDGCMLHCKKISMGHRVA